MAENKNVPGVQTAEELWGHEADERIRYGKGFHWVESPLVLAYINEQITGRPEVDWLTHMYRTYIQGTHAKRILSLGCGGGGLERHLHSLGFGGHIDACDLSPGAIHHARKLAAEQNIHNINYFICDLNQAQFPPDTYDFVLSGSALHHVLNLEHLLDQLRKTLVEGGLLIISEYTGPFKLQWTPQQTQIIDEILHILPPQYRIRVSAPDELKDRFAGPGSIRSMDAIDPTESVRSDEIEPLIQARFSVREQKGFGGTLLQMLLQDIAGNFDPADPIDVGFLKFLIYIEQVLIREGVLKSDFVSLVAEKSKDPRATTPSTASAIDLACELRAKDTRILHLHEHIHQIESELRSRDASVLYMQAQVQELQRNAINLTAELRNRDAQLFEFTEEIDSARAIQAGLAWQTVLRIRQWKERRFPIGSRRRKVFDAWSARMRRL